MYPVITSNGYENLVPPVEGHVLPHEHVLLDMRVWWEGDGTPYVLDPSRYGLTLQDLDWIRRNTHASLRENLVLSDWYLAAKELSEAQKRGCVLLVDLTTAGLDPQPRQAAKAADLAGLGLVTSIGRYLDASLSDTERSKGVDDVVREWTSAVQDGIDGVSIGIIGEIGTSADITPAEVRSLKAAALVQQSTGLAINVHLHPFARRGLEVLQLLEQSGANLERVILSHCDAELPHDWLLALLERGCYIEFDLFGTGPWMQLSGRRFSSDANRLVALGRLADCGYSDRLLVSHDICLKSQLQANGGWGYTYISDYVLPEVEGRLGIDFRRMVALDNPLTVLSVNQ